MHTNTAGCAAVLYGWQNDSWHVCTVCGYPVYCCKLLTDRKDGYAALWLTNEHLAYVLIPILV
jgi:hypothetical protein